MNVSYNIISIIIRIRLQDDVVILMSIATVMSMDMITTIMSMAKED